MRSLITNLFLVLFLYNGFAQTTPPESFNFQAVIYDFKGKPVKEMPVGIEISLYQGSLEGTLVYQETFNQITSEFGVVSLQIGRGSTTQGVFSEIQWGNGPYFIGIAADANGGTNYQKLGGSQLLSVPYALFSKSSKSIDGPNDTDETNEIQELTMEEGMLKLSKEGGEVELPKLPEFNYYYADRDGDGYGDKYASLYSPLPLEGYVDIDGDCNDNDKTIFPGATEVCGDGIDQDCDGSDLLCPDADQDGFTVEEGDCNDNDPAIYPGADDICGDGIDQDCDGSDSDCETIDQDQDGFTPAQGDCDDSDPFIYPGAPVICGDNIDQNCDGDFEDLEECQNDWDQDGVPNDIDNCPETANSDQLDSNGNGIGDACENDICVSEPINLKLELLTIINEHREANGLNRLELDIRLDYVAEIQSQLSADIDGAPFTFENEEGVQWVTQLLNLGYDIPGTGSGYKSAGYPSPQAVLNTLISIGGNNYDNLMMADNTQIGIGYGFNASSQYSHCLVMFYGKSTQPPKCNLAEIDSDGDGYANINSGGQDCNDNEPSAYPGAQEICGDGVDQDCDGEDLNCKDADLDGDGFSINSGDCDDEDDSIYPGAEEICGDGIDQDCDGIDLNCIEINLTWTGPANLDLHLIEPEGEHLYFVSPTTVYGGVLVDSNPNCIEDTGIHAETITYSSYTGPLGFFKVYVDVVNACGGPIPIWTLKITVNGITSEYTNNVDMASGPSIFEPTVSPYEFLWQ